jgi:protein-S-isoprenylcysteine O-methyltransferase Ste14
MTCDDIRLLDAKASIGLAFLIAVMALVLFVPVWTFRYWQAWIYLTIFTISVGAITVYLMRNDRALLARRTNAGPGAEKENMQKAIQSFAQVAFLAVFLVPSLDHRFMWSDVPIYAEIAGDVLVALGLYTVFRVFKENTFASATIEVDKEQRLISSGPYAVVRHPMYGGAFIMLIGTPIALGSWWGLLALIPIVAAIILRLFAEEKFLAKHLAGYADYCTKVRWRLIPGVF